MIRMLIVGYVFAVRSERTTGFADYDKHPPVASGREVLAALSEETPLE
jgi:hypothetical protein